MTDIENVIAEKVSAAMKDLFNAELKPNFITIQKTRKEFKGDFTIVIFPLLKFTGKNLQETAVSLGEYLKQNLKEIESYNVIKGFLNIELSLLFWNNFLYFAAKSSFFDLPKTNKHIMVEFSSPNTNKPLHLGHIRNILIGFSISRIFQETGNKVSKVNLVNDRGIHICKSMLAWQKWGNGETPESSGKKGDHLVGDYYVKFETEYKKEINGLINSGMSKAQAEESSQLILEAREMLRKWENNDSNIINLWKMMNSWVYDGFDETYDLLGINFDKIYYESETFLEGRKLVMKGLEDRKLFKKEDGSVWIDLTNDGLDHKLLIRSDGTSVYMTQDIGTANQRFSETNFDNHIYVVGNEQNYHFQVLVLVLKKLGFDWADKLYHLSYGMVELPDGKMKSREGTVVDADDIIDEMIDTARQMANELGKPDYYNEADKRNVYKKIGLGALKYFILKVDPKKNMVFNPKESIDFNGNTGPFIQYTYARIQSVIRKAKTTDFRPAKENDFNEKEITLLKLIHEYSSVIYAAADSYNPSLIANYLYDIAKEYNQFYHDYSILQAENENIRNYRLLLSQICGSVIYRGMYLLGIEVPERM